MELRDEDTKMGWQRWFKSDSVLVMSVKASSYYELSVLEWKKMTAKLVFWYLEWVCFAGVDYEGFSKMRCCNWKCWLRDQITVKTKNKIVGFSIRLIE